jgi:Mn-dependent DtxR family transcriptional regulator
MGMKYQESEEMYLETILVLKKEKPCVHSIDVAERLRYSRPSVSRAVNLLQKKGFLLIAKNGELTLTEKGEEKAQTIYERHRVLTDILMSTGADRTLAEENACRIEHVISPEMFEILKKFSQKC